VCQVLVQEPVKYLDLMNFIPVVQNLRTGFPFLLGITAAAVRDRVDSTLGAWLAIRASTEHNLATGYMAVFG
jgi:hypothetical protein